MKRWIVMLALLWALSGSALAEDGAGAGATPEETLKNFATALKAGDGKALGACFKTTEFGRELFAIAAPFARASLEFATKLKAAYGDDAVRLLDADVDLTWLTRFAGVSPGAVRVMGDRACALVPGQKLVFLIKENGVWLIFHSDFAEGTAEQYAGVEGRVAVMARALETAMKKIGQEGETLKTIARAYSDAAAKGIKALPEPTRSPEQARRDLQGKILDAVFEYVESKDALPKSTAELGIEVDAKKYRVTIGGEKFDPKVKVERLDAAGKPVPVLKTPRMIRREAREALDRFLEEKGALPASADELGLSYDKTLYEVVVGGRKDEPVLAVVRKGTPRWKVLGAGGGPKDTMRSMAHALFTGNWSQLGDCFATGNTPGALFQLVVSPSRPVLQFSLKLQLAYGAEAATGVMKNLGLDWLSRLLQGVMEHGPAVTVSVEGDGATIAIPGCPTPLKMTRQDKLWRIVEPRVMKMTEEEVETGSDAADALEKALRQAGLKIGCTGHTAATIETLVRDGQEAAALEAAFSSALFKYNLDKLKLPDNPADLGVKYDDKKWKVTFVTAGGWTRAEVTRR